jgi:hypothetical protein
VRFLEAWTHFETGGFTELDLVRLLVPAVLLLLAVFLPGMRVARGLAVGVAASVLTASQLGPPALLVAWCGLWLVVAWLMRSGHAPRQRAPAHSPGGLESGTIGLLLGFVLLALMLVAVGRQDLSAPTAREVSYGCLLVGLGLIHLMLRRDAARGAFALATIGLGLQVLEHAARVASVPAGEPAEPAVWAGTVLAVALAARVAGARRREASSARVSDAHDLHD